MFRWEFSESRESISRIAVPGTLHARGPYSLTGDAHGTVGRPKSGEFLIYSVLQVGRDAILVRIFPQNQSGVVEKLTSVTRGEPLSLMGNPSHAQGISVTHRELQSLTGDFIPSRGTSAPRGGF